MSLKNGKDYLYLIWKNPKTRRQYIVGELSKNGGFEFKYDHEVKEALKDGFELLIAFPEIENKYENKILFPVFASRLPDSKRKDIGNILKKYELDTYNAYELLKKSGARLPIDDLEFIDPILELDSLKIEKYFFLAGPRYYLGCNGTDCKKTLAVSVNEKLKLEVESDNEHDQYAIKIKNNNDEMIGYLPRYYSKSVRSLIEDGREVVCNVIEVNKDNTCSECIKVVLSITKKE